MSASRVNSVPPGSLRRTVPAGTRTALAPGFVRTTCARAAATPTGARPVVRAARVKVRVVETSTAGTRSRVGSIESKFGEAETLTDSSSVSVRG
jgi:hypothetical protein